MMESDRFTFTFILKDKKVFPEPDIFKWAKWLQENDRKIGRTKIENILISTIFLAADAGILISAPSEIFETMVFDENIKEEGKFGIPFSPPLYNFTKKYSTYDEAEAGHKKTVSAIETILQAGGKVCAKENE